MIGFIITMLYIGGVFAYPDKKIGFWRRIA